MEAVNITHLEVFYEQQREVVVPALAQHQGSKKERRIFELTFPKIILFCKRLILIINTHIKFTNISE